MRAAEYGVSWGFQKYQQDVELLTKFKINPTLFENSITKPIEFGSVTLNPDNTLKVYIRETSYDRDGPYNWNSSLMCSGRWTLDANTRVIKLIFENISTNDDGKEVTINDLPTQAETNNFFFEGNFINSLLCNFYYSTPNRGYVDLVKRIS